MPWCANPGQAHHAAAQQERREYCVQKKAPIVDVAMPAARLPIEWNVTVHNEALLQ